MNRYELTKYGRTITYTDDGVGDAILFIHGFCGSADYWKYIIPELSKNHRVLAVNLRGHGGSSTVKEPYGIEEMAEDIKLVMDDLSIGKASVIGHSLGGYTALCFAENYPEKLHSFGLVHSTAFPDSEEGKRSRDAGMKKIESEGIKPFVDQLIPNLFAPENKEGEEAEFARQIGYQTPAAGAVSALEAMKNRPDRRHVIKMSNVPVLLLAGSEDEVISKEKTITADGDHIYQAVLKDAGHMGMLEKPEEFTAILKDFLESFVHPKPAE
ncbi:alpha/beta hydrolase [Bacillus sp. FJAT-42376]|uniref:alpha/beta fold hydrolase n=1 Tax=Bacillus sp. FJAT-42376 TaxID=2014076 RepID=UPI000F4DF374|nr:alpha/beta hydrolase [Bacillus sp. FJAT-42376]AZB43241.1 alpha/beta hydrolase [Bacillus sp. FJAT-42376]